MNFGGPVGLLSMEGSSLSWVGTAGGGGGGVEGGDSFLERRLFLLERCPFLLERCGARFLSEGAPLPFLGRIRGGSLLFRGRISGSRCKEAGAKLSSVLTVNITSGFVWALGFRGFGMGLIGVWVSVWGSTVQDWRLSRLRDNPLEYANGCVSSEGERDPPLLVMEGM